MKNRTFAPFSRVRRRRRGRAGLIVLGAAVAAAHVAVPRTLLAAPRAQVATQQATAGARETVFMFDVPAGPLDAAVAEFERVTGLRVRLANADLATLPSPGVRGTFPARAAMTQMLMGTALGATFGPDGVEIAIASLSESVQVTARGQAVTSPRYTVPLLDIAQTVALVPRAVIEQQAAATLSDALRNVPGITLQAGEGGGASSTAGDMFNMRGFSANNSLFVDNVRDSGLIARDVFNVEQVEVFMGPTGSDVGRGTAAGYVNMQTKRPHAGTDMSVLMSAGTAKQGRVTADVNIGSEAPAGGSWLSHSAVRVNALWQDRGVPGRDYVNNETVAVAPSVALGLNTLTRVFAGVQVVRQDNLPDYGIPSAAWNEDLLSPTTVRPAQAVRQANYYGSPNFDYDRADQTSFFARAEHDLTRRVTLTNQLRYNKTQREAVVSAITNNAAYNPATNLVTIARQGNERENSVVSNQTTLVSRLTTGTLRHGLSVGVEILQENQFAPTLTGFGTRAPVDIFAPNPFDAVTGFAPSRTLAETEGTTNTVAFYAGDAVEMGQRWLVSGGIRAERYETDYRAVDAAGVTTTDLTADGALFSGRASVLYRINNNANVYLSYGTAVTPPGEANFALSAAANNVNNPNVDPQRSENLEVGSKWDVANGRLALNGSVFRTRNSNVIFTVDAAAVPPIFNQNDEQLVVGAAVGALGQVTDRWQVMANFAYLDSSLESQGATNGTRLQLTPVFSGSLWTTVRVAGGLTAGGGIRHAGKSYVNAANTILIPAYTLADGLVEYALNQHLTLRLNIYNLTNESYVRNVNNNGGRYNPSNPRSALFTTNVLF